MTAAELFEVVKDVPREAWPTMAVFVANMWAFETKAWPTGTKSHFMPTEVAEHAFIGSMTAWLVTKGSSPSISMRGDGENRRFITIGYKRPGAMSIVAAIAAACKEAA